MRKLIVFIAISVSCSLFIAGCGDGTEQTSADSIEKINKDLPPDDPNGPGSISPQRGDGGGPVKKGGGG